MSTDYRFNLDVLFRKLCNNNASQDICYSKPLAVIPLNIQQTIFFQRSMLHAVPLQKIISEISRLRQTQKVFIRLSTRSGKDSDISWDSNDVTIILKQFFTSGRVQEDIQEAMTRKKKLSLIIMPFITFGREYRSFIVDGRYVATRADDGCLVCDNFTGRDIRHVETFSRVAEVLLELYGKTSFVFDMGINLSTDELQLIEVNQNDETTDQYMD
jgi:hypothetical protein